jgi:peptidoglycan/LPS O-acetylase OafA/YrhL
LPLVAYATYKNGGNLLNLLPNISLVQSFFPIKDVFFSANAPSWSLSNEMFFYLLFPFLILRGSVFLLFISALIVSLQVYISFTALSQEQQHYWIYIFPVSRLLDFVFGILLFRLYIHFDSKNIKINPDLAQYTSISLLVICIALKDMVPQAYRYDLFYIIPMSMVIFSFAYSGGKISNFLSSKILVLLGEASFSLYLIHQLVIRYIKGVNEVLFGYEGVLWECILIVAILTLSILLSLAMHKLYEIKATKYAKSLLLKIKLRSDEEHNKAIQRTR